MKNTDAHKPVSEAIRKLYPMLAETELLEAETNFRRYVQVAAEVQKERQPAARDFDTIPDPITIKERSNSLKS